MSRVFAHESQCSNVFGHVDVHPEPRRTGCTSDSTACRWVYWVYGVLVPSTVYTICEAGLELVLRVAPTSNKHAL